MQISSIFHVFYAISQSKRYIASMLYSATPEGTNVGYYYGPSLYSHPSQCVYLDMYLLVHDR